MAVGIKIENQFLDTDESTQVTLDMNTELWVTGEPKIQEGSYSLPFDLPLTDKNKSMLRFPDRIDAYTSPAIIDDVMIYIGHGRSLGFPIMVGTLYVKSATNTKVKVFFVKGGLNTAFKNTFAEVDMGTYHIGGPVSPESLMNGTVNYPLLNDFVFFPVMNATLYEMYRHTTVWNLFANGHFGAFTQNHYTPGVGFTLFDPSMSDKIRWNLPITPFLRLEYVLSKVVDLLDYTLINDFQINDELKSICIFNATSINDIDKGFKSKIVYNQHLPASMLLTDFLKQVAKYAFCGLFIDEASKTITLRPYKTVIAAAPRHDWTSRQRHSSRTALSSPTTGKEEAIPALTASSMDTITSSETTASCVMILAVPCYLSVGICLVTDLSPLL